MKTNHWNARLTFSSLFLDTKIHLQFQKQHYCYRKIFTPNYVFPTSCIDVKMTSTRRIRDSGFQGSWTPGQAHAPFSRHAADGVRLKLGDWARRERLVGFRVSPREAWFELARDIIQLFFRVNLLVGEVVTDLGYLKRKAAMIRTENKLGLTYECDRWDRQAVNLGHSACKVKKVSSLLILQLMQLQRSL